MLAPSMIRSSSTGTLSSGRADARSATEVHRTRSPRREASAVVLEVPLFGMGTPTFGLWARTRAFGNQVDRMGFAGINGLLVPEHARGAFNRGQPKNDVVVFPR